MEADITNNLHKCISQIYMQAEIKLLSFNSVEIII